jgi:mannose-1-phosphate guanylyltransferase
VKAIVLVGGEGTRMRPLTYATPKPLLPIANQAFLERQLAWLASYGVDEVVLSLGYLPDAFEAHFPEGRFGDLVLRYAVEDHPLGTAGAIRFAAQGLDERLVVCNGDVLTTLDLGDLVAFHDARGAEATIALTKVADPSAFGVVPTRDHGEVVAFVEKPPKGKAPTNLINAGTYVLEPSMVQRIPERLTVSIERETFPRMLEEPSRLYAMASDAYWIDIGTPEKYLQAHADVLDGVLGGAPAPGAQELRHGVWLQGTVDVHADARIEAPALIGHGSVVAEGARVAGSVIGEGVTVGPGARVLRSVVHDGATISDEAEAIDSVVGEGGCLGSGAIASDHSIVGAAAMLDAGARASGARIRRPEPDAAEPDAAEPDLADPDVPAVTPE